MLFFGAAGGRGTKISLSQELLTFGPPSAPFGAVDARARAAGAKVDGLAAAAGRGAVAEAGGEIFSAG